MVHLKYPSMERQDLTQGQLGSFKFIPVDEAPRPSQYAHPLLLSRWAHLSLDGSSGSQYNHRSPLISDPSFFNHQIRPALDQSRLRLGPAAVRAAVESASPSPQKQRTQNLVQDHMRGNAHAFFPRLLTSSEHDSLPSLYMTETQSSEMSVPHHDNLYGVSPSLLRALENEQDAHNSTKMLLEAETSLREEAVTKIKQLQNQNHGLLNSIKLLQSTVKHLVQKENRPGAIADKALEHAVQEFNKEARNTVIDHSILYDILDKDTIKDSASIRLAKETLIDVNFEPLDTFEKDNHFSKAIPQQDSQTQQEMSSDTQNMNKGDGREEPVDRTVDESNDLNLSFNTESLTTKFNGIIQSKEKTTEDTVSKHDNGSITGPTDNCSPKTNTEPPGPMLELPASFLSKYGKKVVPTEPEISEDEESIISHTMDEDNGVQIAENPGARVEVGNSRLIHSPFINWKINRQNTKELVGGESGLNSRNYFGKYPVRYVPKVTDKNIYRTVMIDFIPIGAKYSDILAHIRGGALESIQLYGPIGKATKFVTARVVFTTEVGATTLYQYGQTPGIKIDGHPVRVWQILEPTYPRNKQLERAISDEEYTRILLVSAPHINNIDVLVRQKLHRQLETGFILDISTSFEGLPMIEFTSIEEAIKALNILIADAQFGGCCFDFEEDYCAARYVV